MLSISPFIAPFPVDIPFGFANQYHCTAMAPFVIAGKTKQPAPRRKQSFAWLPDVLPGNRRGLGRFSGTPACSGKILIENTEFPAMAHGAFPSADFGKHGRYGTFPKSSPFLSKEVMESPLRQLSRSSLLILTVSTRPSPHNLEGISIGSNEQIVVMTSGRYSQVIELRNIVETRNGLVFSHVGLPWFCEEQ